MVSEHVPQGLTRRRLLAGAGAAGTLALVRPARAERCLFPAPGTLVYRILEDGAEAGQASFAFSRQDDAYVVLKTQRIVRRRDGYPIVRLEQKVQEVWRAGWLDGLRAETTRRGGTTRLEGRREGGGLSLARDDGTRLNLAGYLVTDTLWNRDTPYERGLLDVETGHIRLMRGYPRGRKTVPGFGGEVSARHFVIQGQLGLEVWYDDRCRLVRAEYDTHDRRRVVLAPMAAG
jgi:hypothetical protein